jgi:ACGX-repeat protein
MALSNLFGWSSNARMSADASACGASDKPAETPAACGASDKPAETPAACGSACGAGDK